MSATAPPLPPPPPKRPGVSPAPPMHAATPTGSPFMRASDTKPTPRRTVIYAPPGWGKTSLASQAPGAAFLMAPSEQGYITLFHAGRAPDLEHMTAQDWPEVKQSIAQIANMPGDGRTLVIDSLSVFEQMVTDHVLNTHFNDDMRKFMDYGKGMAQVTHEWAKFTAGLESVHTAGWSVLALMHVTIREFKSPLGHAYDRYIPALKDSLWQVINRWADDVLFGIFSEVADTMPGEQRKIGKGGTNRELHLARQAAFDAKNKDGVTRVCVMPRDYTQMYAAMQAALKGEN